jgi:hypothetical protein
MVFGDDPQLPQFATQTITSPPEDKLATEWDDSGFDLDESLYDFETEPAQEM